MKKLTKVLIAGGLIVGAIALKPSGQGALNPNVTQANLAQTVCVPNYTTTIRPPASYTTALKIKQMKERGLTGKPSDYEEDHIVSLSLSGAPSDPHNLEPQPYHLNDNGYDLGALTKDRVETKLHFLLCENKITLEQAISGVRDWRASYRKYIGEWPKYGLLGGAVAIDPDDE